MHPHRVTMHPREMCLTVNKMARIGNFVLAGPRVIHTDVQTLKSVGYVLHITVRDELN